MYLSVDFSVLDFTHRDYKKQCYVIKMCDKRVSFLLTDRTVGPKSFWLQYREVLTSMREKKSHFKYMYAKKCSDTHLGSVISTRTKNKPDLLDPCPCRHGKYFLLN